VRASAKNRISVDGAYNVEMFQAGLFASRTGMEAEMLWIAESGAMERNFEFSTFMGGAVRVPDVFPG